MARENIMSENRLGRETSPYLLQHKDNPVHWWAWGPEALGEAKATGRPILLSVGYAACHWCHVMAHESFEDAETARVMNELFVNIKVDREERPDIDAIYMGALHRLGEQGGWPLTMFLDGDGRPFWGGTYFPKRAQWGRPAFVDVLQQVARIYQSDPDKVENNAEALVRSLQEGSTKQGSPSILADLTDSFFKSLIGRMTGIVDPERGGINGAPKFPQWSFFWLLWRGAVRYEDRPAQHAVETTLANICQGGIYDHLRGGFARYSVDEHWLVPHFEKMLYDNALLIDLITDVWRESANPLWKARVTETVQWLEAEMIAEGGGFAASLDADSEGEEGKFYVWAAAEIAAVLGKEDSDLFSRVYDVSRGGNWEGHNILNRLGSMDFLDEASEARLAGGRATLLAKRSTRVRPGWDDKVLADWNGLMIAALARASQVFGEPRWLELAQRAFSFVEREMSSGERLIHSYRGRAGSAPASAADYANMIWGALRLYEATVAPRYLEAAIGWTQVLGRHFWDERRGGYFNTADDTADVIARLKIASDDAAPNANAVMVSNLAWLGLLTGDQDHVRRAEDIVAAFSPDASANVIGHAGLLASSLDLRAPQIVVIASAGTAGANSLAAAVRSTSNPGALEIVLPAAAGDLPPGLAGKSPLAGRAAAYACLGPKCSAPIQRSSDLVALIKIHRVPDEPET